MTPKQIATIEAGLNNKHEDVFAFARRVLPEEEINRIEAELKAELGYEDLPGVYQWRGGEFATRVGEALRGSILQSMEVFREAVVTHVCPTY
jgi:hypothetical protein